MREDISPTRTAFQMPEGVIFTRVSFDNLEISAVAMGTGVFHEE